MLLIVMNPLRNITQLSHSRQMAVLTELGLQLHWSQWVRMWRPQQYKRAIPSAWHSTFFLWLVGLPTVFVWLLRSNCCKNSTQPCTTTASCTTDWSMPLSVLRIHCQALPLVWRQQRWDHFHPSQIIWMGFASRARQPWCFRLPIPLCQLWSSVTFKSHGSHSVYRDGGCWSPVSARWAPCPSWASPFRSTRWEGQLL